MNTLIVGIVAIIIAMYITFTIKRKRLGKAMRLIRSGEKDQIIMKQTLEQIKNVVNAHFEDVVFTGKTIMFSDNQNVFIVTSIGKKETLISLAPEMDEVKEYEKLEKDILLNNEQDSFTIDEVLQESRAMRASMFRDTPMLEMTKFDWIIASKHSIEQKEKFEAIQQLTHALILTEDDDDDDPLKKLTLLLLEHLSNNDFDNALNEVSHLREGMAGALNVEEQMLEDSILEKFINNLAETNKILDEREKK